MVLNELGMGFDMSPEDEAKAEKMFEDLRKSPAVKNFPEDLNTPEIAARVGALLKTYDQNVIADEMGLGARQEQAAIGLICPKRAKLIC